jgi:hypothetical protein
VPTPETGTTADLDSTVIGRLMGHDAFAHHGLGSAALVIIGALHARRAQTVGELVGSSSVSRTPRPPDPGKEERPVDRRNDKTPAPGREPEAGASLPCP